ncbi:hypothetical protein ACYJW8_15055 [Frateuria aurantia]
MRRLLAIAGLIVPLAVAGQSLLGVDPQQQLELLRAQSTTSTDAWQSRPAWAATPWQFNSRQLSPAQEMSGGESLPFGMVAAAPSAQTQLQFALSPHLQAQATVTQHNWVNTALPVTESELGANLLQGRYSLGFSIGAASLSGRASALPRVLPGAALGLPYTGFGGSTALNAVGRLMLGERDSVHVGASVGRIDLLPGTTLGSSGLDQKALSFGVQHGMVSGVLVGRLVEPLDGVGMGGIYGPDRRWSSLDFGVTWRLPWQGQISVGAHNLWSSGNAMGGPGGPAGPPGPAAVIQDQSRTPYVQYHQDL